MRCVQGLFFPGGNSCRRHKANKSPTCTIRPSHKCWEPRKYSFSSSPIGTINPRSLCYQLRWKKQGKAQAQTIPFSPAGPWLGSYKHLHKHAYIPKVGHNINFFFPVSRCQNPKSSSSAISVLFHPSLVLHLPFPALRVPQHLREGNFIANTPFSPTALYKESILRMWGHANCYPGGKGEDRDIVCVYEIEKEWKCVRVWLSTSPSLNSPVCCLPSL